MGLFGNNDITFCANNNCVLRQCCRRAKLPKDDPWCCMAQFPLNPDGSCDYMLEIKGKK